MPMNVSDLAFVPVQPPADTLAMPLLTSRNYRCQCGQPVYFRNSACLTCGTALGYQCDQNQVLPLMPALADTVAAAQLDLPPFGALQPVLWQVWQSTAAGSGPDAAFAAAAAAAVATGAGAGAIFYQDPAQAPPPLQLQDLPGQQATPPLQAPPPDTNAPPLGEPSPLPPEPPLKGGDHAFAGESGVSSVFGCFEPVSSQVPALYKRCTNLATPAACNWLIAAQDPHDFCRACRLNRTIPDLMDTRHPDNGYLWGLVEAAKRRLVSSLIALGLPVASRVSEDPQRGLMFDLLRSSAAVPHVMTGHDSGLITLNVDEADDAKREQVRQAMREPYRTLLGHFRHEVGHYYWDRLIQGTPWLDDFHTLFGDESLNYAQALQRHYTEGPSSDWPHRFVSAYASTHPWEDWAECWAHYMHMRDAVDTARGFGLMSSLDTAGADLEFTPFTLTALWRPDDPSAADFLAFMNHWSRLTMLLNQMSRSMGQPDFYPFTVPVPVVAKLHFIHEVIVARQWEAADVAAVQPALRMAA